MLVLALLGLLAGCASVPTSGSIRQGPVVDSGPSTQFIRVIAAPPSAGAQPSEVVTGFLEANASLESEHGIARQYLTRAAAARWAPEQRTTVYSLGSLQVTGSGNQVRASMDVTGELLADGTLRTVDPATPRRLDLHLTRVGQGSGTPPEWRIADPPSELLVSDADLRRAYREHQVYFVSARTGTLVPDGRLLPVVGSALPTALAEEVLAGPSKWLAAGVVDSVPKGTKLALGAVTVSNSLATVELTSDVVAATPKEREALAAQLTWTLTSLPDISAIQIMVGGSPLEFPGTTLLLDRSNWEMRAPDAPRSGRDGSGQPPDYRLVGGTVVRTTTAGTTTLSLPARVPSELTSLAVSLDERVAAVTEKGGTGLWLVPLDARSTEKRFPGTGIESASFDSLGRLWFASGGVVRRLDRDGTLRSVARPGGPAEPVTRVRVAADGTRIALVAGGRVELAVIQERSGHTVLRSSHPIAGGIASVRDVAWRGATDLDVLGYTRAGLDVQRVTLASGLIEPLRAPEGTVGVASAPGGRTLARTSGGEVLGNIGLQWREQGRADAVAYPG